jgi:alkanesulfonate monooxygenase SsuD/methylene tetrahydromethanopterin reductase-like flavin-dependent oxidoreductase (luciferase family)
MPIIGARAQVAEKLARFYLDGLDCVPMCFLSYLEDTVRFRDEIVPLLEQLGVCYPTNA